MTGGVSTLGTVAAPGPARPSGARAALWLAATVAPLAVAVGLFEPWMHRAWPAPTYLSVHLVVEVLVALVAGATFAIQARAGARVEDARARFIGTGFLAVALLEVVHLLAFAGMPGLPWLGSSTERGIVYWLAARLLTVLTLLGAYAVPPASRRAWLLPAPLAGVAVGSVGAVLLLDAAWISRAPVFYVEGQGLTGTKIAAEGIIAALAIAGAALYERRRRTTGDPDAHRVAQALWLTAVSELCFMGYARAHDSFNLVGHLYLLFAFQRVYRALFANAIVRPYEELARSHAEAQALRHRIEGELEVTIRELEATEEERRDLLRAVSHDLRTPLQVVLLRAEVVLRTSSPGSDVHRAAQAIALAGRQIGTMLQDLVDAVRLERGGLDLASARIELGEFLGDVLAGARGALDTERVRLELEGRLPVVEGDPARLARVVHNLVGNALKYSAPGTPVVVRAQAERGEVVVEVRDQGPGIPPEDLPRLFTRFFRGAGARRADGLGLGLYISRMIVLAHGGRVACESQPGAGSVFLFALPAPAEARRAVQGDVPAPAA